MVMNDLENGIKNLKIRLKENLDKKTRKILEGQLQSMESEKTLREMSPQPFYKDHG